MIICAEVDSWIGYGRCCRTVCLHREVVHVSGVRTLRVLESMLFAVRIEMGAGGLESWTFTFGRFMKVDRMHARSKIFQIELDTHALSFCRHLRCADTLSLGVF